MTMVEFLDIFDADFKYLGKEERDEVHRKGMWHQVFHCWVVLPNNKIVVQLRGRDKSTNPNLLDISGAGHLSAGEKMEDGIRELEEELGLKVDFNDLIYLGYTRLASDSESKKIVPYHNREFAHTFFLKSNLPLKNYKLQEEELDGVFELDINDGRKLFLSNVDKIKISGYIRKDGNLLEKNERFVVLDDFVRHDNLWLKIFNLVEDLNNNRKNLFI